VFLRRKRGRAKDRSIRQLSSSPKLEDILVAPDCSLILTIVWNALKYESWNERRAQQIGRYALPEQADNSGLEQDFKSKSESRQKL
jgi:hypothetical protein